MLRFPVSSSEKDLRLAILECGQICYERSLMMSNDGNISVRLDETRVLITPAGISKGCIAADDLLCIDFNGGLLEAKSGGLPSSETPMHLEAYRQRPDIRAVIHAHPVFATALTVAGMDFPSDVLPEVLLALGEVPVSDYATPSSHDDAIRVLIREHNAVLLRQHGTLTVGIDLEEALIHLERVEHVAEVFWRAHMLGHVEHLPPEARERLLAVRKGRSVKGAS